MGKTRGWPGMREGTGMLAFLCPRDRYAKAVVAGVVLVVLAVGMFRLAVYRAHGNGISVPSLLFPYLAAVCVFVATCLWIFFSAHRGVPQAQLDPTAVGRARLFAFRCFAAFCVCLLFSGLAAKVGDKAMFSLNWYMFGPADDPLQNRHIWTSYGMPFAVLLVLGNSLAFSTLIYLGNLCMALVDNPKDQAADLQRDIPVIALRIGDAGRRLRHFLVMASALAVTSTLTLYLVFGLAEQIEPIQAEQAVKLKRPDAVPPKTSSADGHAATLACQPPMSLQAGLTCRIELSAEKTPQNASTAAYMALVAGLSFTGVLFVLFASCNVSLDDQAADLACKMQRLQAASSSPFNLKEWREQHGLDGAGAGAQMLQALAFAAPALTGLVTLLRA